MRTIVRWAAAVLALTFASSGLDAQVSTAVAGERMSMSSPQTVNGGPTITRAAAGVRAVAPVVHERSGLSTALQQESQRGLGRNVALMIVGGAAVVTGLLIGDDLGTLLAVGGAAVGLYGLYNYVR